MPPEAGFGKVPTQVGPLRPGHVSHVSKAYRQLRDLLVDALLAPGTRIVEVDLASRLGVSRTPVRDALRLLQQEGFVTASSPGGFKARLIVAPLTKEDTEDLHGIVGRLKGWAAHLTSQLPGQLREALGRKLRVLKDGLRELVESSRRDPQRTLALVWNFTVFWSRRVPGRDSWRFTPASSPKRSATGASIRKGRCRWTSLWTSMSRLSEASKRAMVTSPSKAS